MDSYWTANFMILNNNKIYQTSVILSCYVFHPRDYHGLHLVEKYFSNFILSFKEIWNW